MALPVDVQRCPPACSAFLEDKQALYGLMDVLAAALRFISCPSSIFLLTLCQFKFKTYALSWHNLFYFDSVFLLLIIRLLLFVQPNHPNLFRESPSMKSLHIIHSPHSLFTLHSSLIHQSSCFLFFPTPQNNDWCLRKFKGMCPFVGKAREEGRDKAYCCCSSSQGP